MTQRRRQVVSQRNTITGRLGLAVLCLLTIHTFATLATAQDASQPTTRATSTGIENEKIGGQQNNTPTNSYGAWGQLLLAMAIVVGLIVGLGWLVKRLGGGKGLRTAGTLKLIARATLSPKHQMFLVRMGRRLVLIGTSPQGLATLSEVTDTAEVADLLRSAGFKDATTEGGKA